MGFNGTSMVVSEIEDDVITNSGAEVEFGTSINSWKLTKTSIRMVMLIRVNFDPWAVEYCAHRKLQQPLRPS